MLPGFCLAIRCSIDTSGGNEFCLIAVVRNFGWQSPLWDSRSDLDISSLPPIVHQQAYLGSWFAPLPNWKRLDWYIGVKKFNRPANVPEMEWIWVACFGEFLGIWKLCFVDFQASIRSSWKMHMLRILATYKKENFVAITGRSMPSTSHTSSYMLFYMTALVLVCISFKVLLWDFLCNLIPVILVKCYSCQITARFLMDCNAKRCMIWAPRTNL
jgi:hypothetical protein